MKYCKRCLYPENHPLNITFDNEGVCSGCRIHEEKDVLDWDLRIEKLKKLVEPYKKSSRSINNCIVLYQVRVIPILLYILSKIYLV